MRHLAIIFCRAGKELWCEPEELWQLKSRTNFVAYAFANRNCNPKHVFTDFPSPSLPEVVELLCCWRFCLPKLRTERCVRGQVLCMWQLKSRTNFVAYVFANRNCNPKHVFTDLPSPSLPEVVELLCCWRFCLPKLRTERCVRGQVLCM